MMGRPRKADKLTNAEKVAAFVARRNELGEIPPVENPERKESCRLDLEAFGWNYCRDLLRHRASPDIRDGLIRDAQECILNGGQTAELYARGGGKTTWIVYIAAIWAILYGHRRFVVIIGASIAAAKKSLKTIKRILARSPQFLADFPAVAVGIQALKGVSQRAAAQTYNHVPTDIEWGAEQITLPTLRGDDGELLDPACGGILAATGVGGAIRGANEGGQRPDMLLFDDPQTKKAAASPKLVESILEFIHSDALGLAGHDSTIAAFLTITPQRFGDVATAISSRDQYPEWSVKVQPFIKTLPDRWDQLVELFCAEYAQDAAARDFRRTRSTAWYRDNRDLFAGMETIDPLQFDKAREIDINHHLLNLRAKMGKQAFDAEIMMHVADAATELKLDVGRVCNALNGAERGVCPPGTDTVVGFCDVNIKAGAGLSWVLVAFGPRRVAAVIDYGRLPADGTALVPENASETDRDNIVASAMREVVQYVASRKIRDSFGRAVRVRAFGFDRGWLPAVVHRTLFVLRRRLPLGFEIAAARGYSWQGYNESKSTTIRTGDHMKAAPSKYGQFLGYMAPYWREVMQSGLLGMPLTPGSLSIFGSDPAEHRRFAQEICAERLVRKYQIYGGGASKSTTVAWDWNTTGPEHWCDALTGAFVMASWYRAYDALSSTVDAAALGVKVAHEIVAPPLEDMERDMEDAPLAPLPARLAVRRKVKPKFKRGRYIK